MIEGSTEKRREWERIDRFTFAAAITAASRATTLHDRLIAHAWRLARLEMKDIRVSRQRITTDASVLDAAYVEPALRPVDTVLLICHGIGEIVDGWLPVQRLLAAHGCASLVFDYSGYGRSRGHVGAAQFEDDAVAAFAHLQELAEGKPVAVLGFSLGTGVAAAAMGRMAANRLVLCAGFPSFREAACSFLVPKRWGHLVPPIWKAEESLRDCRVPVLVVHGEKDRMFPVELGEELHALCGDCAEFLVIPGQGHNEPFRRPTMEYWGPILEWLRDRDQGSGIRE
ncbi:alpha/beta hydrolase [Acidicapsa dinghuensis]|uniref:Alpha/beta hydrolase n=1 Tax=Acidicapsa dinghuensis TaxID=2218256 RepID=A0ABW1EFA5_9BACT|nr:alpha/beta hydrolase [Acidicapsa dinghuensis]